MYMLFVRFCRRILVRKIGTGETMKKWYFYLHQWFDITAKGANIILEVPATTRPERKAFSARFRENLMEQIDNVNLWISIFRYSPAFTFTRCQRLSCAFAVLASYLLINIMFYGMLTEDESKKDGSIKNLMPCLFNVIHMCELMY